jgi:seryl-tRNA synthetase
VSDIEQYILNKLEKLDEKLDEVREHNVAVRASFDAHVDMDEKIHQEVIKLGDSIDKHSRLLDEYNHQLEIHIKRTELLEHKVLPLVEQKKEQEVIKRWQDSRWARIAKVAGWLTALAGLVAGVLEIMSKLG